MSVAEDRTYCSGVVAYEQTPPTLDPYVDAGLVFEQEVQDRKDHMREAHPMAISRIWSWKRGIGQSSRHMKVLAHNRGVWVVRQRVGMDATARVRKVRQERAGAIVRRSQRWARLVLLWRGLD